MITKEVAISSGDTAEVKVNVDVPESLDEFEEIYGATEADVANMAGRELVRKIQSVGRTAQKANKDVAEAVGGFKLQLGAPAASGHRKEINSILKGLDSDQQIALLAQAKLMAETESAGKVEPHKKGSKK